jgi:hypothetical protein
MRTRGKAGPKPKFPPGVRICTDCGGTKPVTEFVPIRKTKTGFYGPCRPCITRRAWETRHPGRSYEEHLAEKSAIDGSPKGKPKGLPIVGAIDASPKQKAIPTSRTCTDCKLTRPISEFQPIKACKLGWYGRCRACRARRARERYHSSPAICAAEITRASKNRRLRQISRSEAS